MNRKHPLLMRLSLWVLLPMTFAICAGYAFLSKSLPRMEGSVTLQGLHETVTVHYDADAIPTISASTDNDAFFAIGYVHASHRLWQMESQRRLGQGTLSEVFGRTTIKADHFMRTLGLHQAAKDAANNLSLTALSSLTAYAEGVNAFLSDKPVLPPEFLLLGYKPERWSVVDSLLQMKLVSLNLDGSYEKDLAFSLLVKTVGWKRASEIKTHNPEAISAVSQATSLLQEELLALSESIDHEYGLGGEGVGSNAWVVSGDHTESKMPLLANDPHLKTQMPTAWYMAAIKGKNINVVGATIPGLPLVLSGHNQNIAWGITALRADVQDLYLERTEIENDNRYELNGEWQKMTVREEVINIKSDFPTFLHPELEPLRIKVRSTHHGPLLSDTIGRTDTPLALRWTALDKDDGSYASFLQLNYARTWQEFRHALTNHVSPALNFVYADTQGNIGYLVAGRVPIRKKGDGTLPLQGWNEEFEWQGYIPNDELPRILNPPAGFIVTANNQPHGADYPYFMSKDWAPGYRAQRITDLLEQKIKSNQPISKEYIGTMMGDVKNTQAAQLMPTLLAVTPSTKREEQALEILADWTLEADKESIAETLFHAWRRHFSMLLLSDALQAGPLETVKRNELSRLRQQIFPLFLNDVVNGGLSHWCGKTSDTGMDSCVELAGTALVEALDELEKLGGASIKNWQWGKLHNVHYPHSAFSNIAVLDLLFDRRIPHAGDLHTVNVAFTYYSKEFGYVQVTGANYRQIISLQNWSDSLFITDTGQSGNLLSTHYDDLMTRHSENQFLSMPPGDTDKSQRRLLLIPESKKN